MKTIAVLIYDITVEYHITVVDGILSYFDNKRDVCMLIAPVNVPHATTNKYDYQYWTIVDVLKNKDVDLENLVKNCEDEEEMTTSYLIFVKERILGLSGLN